MTSSTRPLTGDSNVKVYELDDDDDDKKKRNRVILFASLGVVAVFGLMLFAGVAVFAFSRSTKATEVASGSPSTASEVGEWTQQRGKLTVHLVFNPDGTTKSWATLTRDEFTAQGKMMKGGTVVPDGNGNPAYVAGWWKKIDSRIIVKVDGESQDLPLEWNDEKQKWKKVN
jgi:hypothetical protein